MKYDFLLSYLNPPKNISGKQRNWFYSIKSQDITDAEKNVGILFPSQLKEFYSLIGYGSLSISCNAPENYIFSNANLILSPDMIENILLKGVENDYMIDSTYELLEPGDLPFFEIGDSTRFLLMKLNSDNPNAVWCYDIKIEDSFDKFIWRLYYESPWFYDDIIEAHYKNK